MAGFLTSTAGGRQAARLHRRGMTLVEITVVVIILGISVVVVATGTMMAMRDRETLKAEARSLAGFLQNIRMQAAIKGQAFEVEYNLRDQVYFPWIPKEPKEGEVVQENDDGTSLVAGGFHEMPSRSGPGGQRVYTVWIDRIALGDGSVVRDEVYRTRFSPRGGGHWHYVYLTNAEGDFYTIEINPFTGAADITPGEHKPEPPERLQ